MIVTNLIGEKVVVLKRNGNNIIDYDGEIVILSEDGTIGVAAMNGKSCGMIFWFESLELIRIKKYYGNVCMFAKIGE